MVVVEPGSKLCELHWRVCGERVQPGQSVLVALRGGRPSVIHAYLCAGAPSSAEGSPGGQGDR
jgi:hypothetical protein